MLYYAKHNIKSFDEQPFNRVDALILCWLAYFTFPDKLKGEEEVAIKDLEKLPLLPDKEMFAQAYHPEKSRRLLDILVKSPRFQNVSLSRFAEEKEEAEEKQFAALCFNLGNVRFLAFRGTDPSFVGWKEDFNLACRFPVPSQRAALSYTRKVFNSLSGDFYLGGHSKGGNIATFSAMNLPESEQNRIVSVFDFDGPGYAQNVFADGGYMRVQDKINKTVPSSSFVGMLLNTPESYNIIRSKGLSLLQHDPFFWTVKGGDFIPAKGRTRSSEKLARAMNGWIDEFSLPERERMVKLIYGALYALDIRDFNVFFRTLHKQIPRLIKEYKRTDGEDKKFFNEKIKRFMQLYIKTPSAR